MKIEENGDSIEMLAKLYKTGIIDEMVSKSK